MHDFFDRFEPQIACPFIRCLHHLSERNRRQHAAAILHNLLLQVPLTVGFKPQRRVVNDLKEEEQDLLPLCFFDVEHFLRMGFANVHDSVQLAIE